MFNFFKTTNPDCNLKFYMKSGNSFVIDKVRDWKFQPGAMGNIVALQIEQRAKAKNKLIVQSIDLTQIEAIMEVEG